MQSFDNVVQKSAKVGEKKTLSSFSPGVIVSDSLWIRCSAFCSVHLSPPLCLAGEAAAINKTQRWSVRPAVLIVEFIASLWSECKHDFLSLSLPLFFPAQPVVGREKKKNLFCINAAWKIQQRSRAFGWRRCSKYQSKSDILWWHVLVIRRCPMKNWKQRYVGVDFDHCRPRLSSAAVRRCQTRSKRGNMCFRPGFPPTTRTLRVPVHLKRPWTLEIRATVCSSIHWFITRGTTARICDRQETRDSHEAKLRLDFWGHFVGARFI